MRVRMDHVRLAMRRRRQNCCLLLRNAPKNVAATRGVLLRLSGRPRKRQEVSMLRNSEVLLGEGASLSAQRGGTVLFWLIGWTDRLPASERRFS